MAAKKKQPKIQSLKTVASPSDKPLTWRNLARSVKRVAKGGRITVEVEGGWIRRDAHDDGYLIETREGSVFVTAEQLRSAE